MSDFRVRFIGDPITHLVLWSDSTWGHTYCELGFVLRLSYLTETIREIDVIDTNVDCDCMICLVAAARKP